MKSLFEEIQQLKFSYNEIELGLGISWYLCVYAEYHGFKWCFEIIFVHFSQYSDHSINSNLVSI